MRPPVPGPAALRGGVRGPAALRAGARAEPGTGLHSTPVPAPAPALLSGVRGGTGFRRGAGGLPVWGMPGPVPPGRGRGPRFGRDADSAPVPGPAAVTGGRETA